MGRCGGRPYRDFEIEIMNYDEFAFFNRQLAGMLRDGIPLEGAIKQLCEDMRAGPLRQELELLEQSLSRGAPLKEALAERKLPDFYKTMLQVGVRANDLPGTLTLVADYYERANSIWTRLKGLLVYPVIVIAVSLVLTTFLCIAFNHFLNDVNDFSPVPAVFIAGLWVPPVRLMTCFLVIGIYLTMSPSWRARLRWKVPAFREASLSQLASAIALMLRKGTPLPEALATAEALESGTQAGEALREWRRRIESGAGGFTGLPALKPFPPLFVWMLQKNPEQPAEAFQEAADLYNTRAGYRIELALYGALPVSMLLLGQMIFWQMAPMLRTFIYIMNSLGDMGGS
jgi:type II secretory pathway component PulF